MEVTGIFRASSVRLNAKQRRIRSIFRTYVDVVNVSLMNKDPAIVTSDGTSKVDAMIKNFAEQPRLYERLANSIGKFMND